jgi:hypothetical protein
MATLTRNKKFRAAFEMQDNITTVQLKEAEPRKVVKLVHLVAKYNVE